MGTLSRVGRPLAVLVAGLFVGACAVTPTSSDQDAAVLGAGGSATGGAPTGTSAGMGGVPAEGGAAGGSAGGVSGIGGVGGRAGSSGGSGATGDAGPGSGSGGAGNGGTGGSGASNCNLPVTVSFQKDIQPFLSTACGGGNGCHVIDSASTVANGGYDHAYDWITAGAHPSSCPNTPTPKRFDVVIAVVGAANPASCSKARIMPPRNETGANLRPPLTSCQIAALQAWLKEPWVTQSHRVDDTDPAGTPPFPMPPFN